MSAHRPQRVRQGHVDWLLDHLNERDQRIAGEVAQMRLLTSSQIERLCFANLTGRSRSVTRSRVLKRLTDWRVLGTLPRRVGGYGSTQAVYFLDSAGQAIAASWDSRPHRAGLPGERFVRHVLAVSELYVGLVERTRGTGFGLLEFRAEPAAWLPDGLGGLLKPDAFLSLAANGLADDWFCEIDLATEHLPTIKGKAEAYLSFYQRGQLGPNGVMPKVLFSVPDERRQTAIAAMLARSFPATPAFFHVTTQQATVPYLMEVLRE